MRKEHDFYPTPPSFIQALFYGLGMLRVGEWVDHTSMAPIIWEPCCGDGRIVNKFKGLGWPVVGTDIQQGQDFFKYEKPLAPVLVTNPPFKVIRQFIDHAFNIGVQRMVLLCPYTLWACAKGHEQWLRHKPTYWASLTWREDFLQAGGMPDRTLAVGIWNFSNAPKCEFLVWPKG